MIQEFVDDIEAHITDARNLKKFVSGPIISIPLNERQEARIEGIVHALEGIRDKYVDEMQQAVTIMPDGNGGLNVHYPDGDMSEGLDIDEIQAGVERYYTNRGLLK
jgi:hypothetical protein